MTPTELARSNSEHGHQRALFAWCNLAARHGFDAAWDDRCYKEPGYAAGQYGTAGVTVLDRIFAIPNGGLRDKVTAAKLKAEGVKDGVPDTFLPLPRSVWAGLFIEMKRPGTTKAGKRKAVVIDQQAGATSAAQDDWTGFLRSAGYGVAVAFSWDEAAKQIREYVEYAG